MTRATRYMLRFYLVIFFGVLGLGVPLAYAQTVPLGEYTCLAPDQERGGPSGIAFAEEVRAMIVLVRFKDDNWGDCGKWWCEMPEWPQCEDHYDPQCSVVPKTELPDWGTTLLHPDETDFPASSISLPSNSPIADSSLSAFFWEQSRTGSGAPHRFWGDVLPQDAQDNPYVYVTQDSTKYYYNDYGGGFGDLTTEILAHLDSTGVDFSDYDANDDGYVDHIFLIVRRALYRDEDGEWQGHSGGGGWVGLNGHNPLGDSPAHSGGGFSSTTIDSVTVDRNFSGSTNHLSGRGWGLLAHEYMHEYLDMNHTKIIEDNDVPLVVPPPGEKGHAACAYNMMCGTNASTNKSNYNPAGGAMSAWERRRAGWIDPVVLDATSAPDASDLSVGDFYLTGDAYYFPLKAGSAADTLVVENRQNSSFFSRRTFRYPSNPDYDVIRKGLATTGLFATLSQGPPDSSYARGYFYDLLLADNEFEHVSECIGEAENCIGLGVFDGDMYGPETEVQITPWTRPNVSGYSYYPFGFEPNWFAIDDIRYVANDPDSTMAFDYYADYRTASTVAIRNDSWMGAETSGTTFPNEVRVTGGATLTIEPGTELAFGGGLTVEDGAHVVFQPGSIARFGEGVGFSIEGTADIQGTSASPVVFEGDGLFPYQRWGGIVIQGSNTSLSYVEVSEAGIGIEVRARNVSLDHLTLDGSSLVTDYAWCGDRCLRSSIELTNSTITGSEGDGLVLRNVDTFGDGIRDNTISDNDLHGVVVWNADVAPFELNVVEGNGIGFTYVPNVKYDGIAVLSNGSLHLSEASVFYGYNRIADNWDDELSVASGGYLFVGDTGSGYNTIEKTGKSSAASGSEKGAEAKSFAPDYPRHIETASTVYAQNTWWGSSSGPPSGAFGGSGTVYYAPFLTSEPPGVARPGDDSMLLAANGSKGEGGDLAWLREQILHVRGLLAEGPVAPGLVRRLYALQRIDAGDVLGEHEATMTLLADVRSLLDGEPEGATRRAAEAALGAEVSDALRQEDYDAAEALVTTYAAVVAETEEQDLALGVVAVDEQAGRYAEALQRIEAVIVSLGEDEAALARSLEGIAALIEAKLDGEGRGATPLQATAGAKSAAGLPAEYALEAAYPNPFSRSATLPVALPGAADVRVAVYDLLGREVAVVADERLEAGRHTLIFDGSRLASGVYVVRASLRGSGAAHVLTRRITLVK